MHVIEASHLHYRFPDGSPGINDVSLNIEAGEFTIIIGANGSGKTTLLKHFNGLIIPDSGTVSIRGLEVKKNVSAVRKQVGMVFQDADSQIVGDSVYDDVAFGPENLRLDRAEIDRRVEQALFDVGLDGFEKKSPHNLSGGEKRLLAIAGVLAMKPQVILLDEPFSNLDYSATCTVLKQIVKLHGMGHVIVITTHDLEKVISCVGRVIIMQKGQIVGDGSPEEVIHGIERFGVRPPCSVQLGMGIQAWAQ